MQIHTFLFFLPLSLSLCTVSNILTYSRITIGIQKFMVPANVDTFLYNNIGCRSVCCRDGDGECGRLGLELTCLLAFYFAWALDCDTSVVTAH